MSQLVERLQRALGDAYRIERELGGGGMSRVFLAAESSLHRTVVVKVLPPELASDVSAQRFKQEIELAAHLQHPNILPVLAAGSNEGLLYYIMPYVQGESLRHRLSREGRLPVADAARILHEVADALAHAHGHGVIHRDIKPENILLEGGHAVLTDFGVSRALAVSRSGGPLTETGMAVGSPGYMSPEQAAGERHVDARADVYGLAVVGYEMLAGAPPFDGPTAQAILAAHLSEPPRPVRELRSEVPPRLEAVVAKGLAKAPEERFHSAAELRDAIGLEFAGEPARPAIPWKVALAGAGVVVAAIAAVVLVVGGGGASGPVDANVVTVLPFRVTGADASLGYLREGMVDLLAAKLTGEGGPRAVDPRTALAAWRRAAGSPEADLPREAAADLARGLGSGRVVLGEIVGTGTRLVINASLVPVGALSRGSQTGVEGSVDSLLPMVDRLAAQLLALGAGEGQRLEAATSTSLPALRAYLDGRVAYRAGRYGDAVSQFERALSFDSTFALAGMGLYTAAFWIADGAAQSRGLEVAWRHVDRLSARDRVLLETWRGRAYPEPEVQQEILAVRRRAMQLVPDQPEAWYFLGDQLFHLGPVLGVPEWKRRAYEAFERAALLDSTFSGALQHLVDLAAVLGDAGATRRWGRMFFAVDSTADFADYLRWRLAVTSGDARALEDLRSRYEGMSEENLRRIMGWMQVDGIQLEELPRVAQAHAASLARGASAGGAFHQWGYLLNSGRPVAAEALRRERAPDSDEWLVIGSVTYGSDSAAAHAAVKRGEQALQEYGRDPSARAAVYQSSCDLARWYLSVGSLADAARLQARGRAAAVSPGADVRPLDLPARGGAARRARRRHRRRDRGVFPLSGFAAGSGAGCDGGGGAGEGRAREARGREEIGRAPRPCSGRRPVRPRAVPAGARRASPPPHAGPGPAHRQRGGPAHGTVPGAVHLRRGGA